MPRSPFEEDKAACDLAERWGFALRRKPVIRIEDEAALLAAGLTTLSIDWRAVRKLLESGMRVQGASLDGVEYVLKVRP